MTPRTTTLLLAALALAACSAEDRAERRLEQIEADVAAKAEAGTLSFEELGRAADEVAELQKHLPPLEERLRDARAQHAAERQQQHELARAQAASRADETYAKGTAALQTADDRYNELLSLLTRNRELQPSNFIVYQQAFELSNFTAVTLQRLQTRLENRADPLSMEAALTELETLNTRLQADIDNAAARIARLQAPSDDPPTPQRATTTVPTTPPNPSSLQPTPSAANNPGAAPPQPPTIDELRADATVAATEVEALHDQLIGLLEAIAAAADDTTKRRANHELTLARFAKRQQMSRLRSDIAADPQWRIEGALRSAARARTQLQAQIASIEPPE